MTTLRIIAKRRGVDLVVTDDSVERKVTGHEAASVNGDEEGSQSKRLRPAELARRRRHATDQNLAGSSEALNTIGDVELDVFKSLETLRELLRLVFLPEKPDLELAARRQSRNAREGCHRQRDAVTALPSPTKHGAALTNAPS